MKKSKLRWATAHLHKGKESMLVKLTTGPNWGGGKEFKGKVVEAWLDDGRYYDDDGGFFCIGDRSWVVLNGVS